jgi:hypothetical protein
MRGRGGIAVAVSANEYSCAHEAQINFGDLTPYLTYGFGPSQDGASTDVDEFLRTTFLECLSMESNFGPFIFSLNTTF